MNSDIEQIVGRWQSYVDTIADWQNLVESIAPKQTPCGPVYDIIPNPPEMSEYVGEGLAVCDMREVTVAEPHYHTNGETEIYIVISGTGTTYVGGMPQELKPGVAIATAPEIVHFTIPDKDLVLAVVNTPPFDAYNVVEVSETDERVGFDKEQYESLKQSKI